MPMMTAQDVVTTFGARKREINDDQNNDRSYKRKINFDERFEISGNYDDEITMLFDDMQELYVSKNFLRHVSQVFFSMFEKKSKFVENKKGIIKMVNKCYESVLGLLLHLDPSIQTEIDGTNVFGIVHLAEEYMILGSIRKCRHFLMTMINTKFDHCSSIDRDQADIVEALLTAIKYEYKDIGEQAIKVIAKWKHFGSKWPQSYNRLPDEYKLKILEKRLNDKGDKLVPPGKSVS